MHVCFFSLATLSFLVDFSFERTKAKAERECLSLKASHFCCDKGNCVCIFKVDALFFLTVSPWATCLRLMADKVFHRLKEGLNPFFLSQPDVRRVEGEVSVAPVTTLSD